MSIALVPRETVAKPVSTDRRQGDRVRVRCNALITVFDSAPSEMEGSNFEEPFRGTLVNVSDVGAQVNLDRPVPLGALLKIECTDFLLLGEAVYCREDQGNWVVGIHVEHGLYGLKALAEAIQDSWQ